VLSYQCFSFLFVASGWGVTIIGKYFWENILYRKKVLYNEKNENAGVEL